MKTLTKTLLVAAGLAVAALPLLQAANATRAPRADRPALRALLERRAAVRKQVLKRLDLTADQITQLKTKRAGIGASVKAIRADASLTAEQKREKVRAIVQTARADLRGVLTPEQQTKLERIRTHLKHRASKR